MEDIGGGKFHWRRGIVHFMIETNYEHVCIHSASV